MDGPLDRFQFRTQELVNEYPPRLHHRSTRVVYDTACADDGNKVFMAILQVLAAQMTGIDQLHSYTVTDREVDTMYYAHGRLGEIGDGGSIATSECIRRVVALELRWGVRDGN